MLHRCETCDRPAAEAFYRALPTEGRTDGNIYLEPASTLTARCERHSIDPGIEEPVKRLRDLLEEALEIARDLRSSAILHSPTAAVTTIETREGQLVEHISQATFHLPEEKGE